MRTLLKKLGVAAFMAAALFMFAGTAGAVNCHCFNQREFDPLEPASADPYILATAGNTLLAASAGAEKSAVVKMRMGGVEEWDLWIALWASRASSVDPGRLLDAREKRGSWPKAFSFLGVDPAKLGENFAALIVSDDQKAALVLADAVLASTFGGDAKAVETLRAEGARTGEAAVALFLKSVSGANPAATLKEVRAGRATWGTLLNKIGYTPKLLSTKIAAIAKSPF